jgi:hypothetical protein
VTQKELSACLMLGALLFLRKFCDGQFEDDVKIVLGGRRIDSLFATRFAAMMDEV